MSTPPIKPLATRERLSEVRYEIRGELAPRARDLEAQGRKLIKLTIGNPGAFGFRAPAHLQRAIIDAAAARFSYRAANELTDRVVRWFIDGYYGADVMTDRARDLRITTTPRAS